MNPSKSGRSLRTALVVVLCALFFVLAMGITLLGSSVYRGVVAASDRNYTQRTALSYLINQVRRSPSVGVGSFELCPALDLGGSGEEADYHTVLYVYDGQLRELYTQRNSGLTPADGTAILPLEDLQVALENGLITLTVTTEDGKSYSASVAPRVGAVSSGEVTG
ncbi:hypothetical protein B5G43_13505 [Flavonifractor sp. An92]|uniref:DUF4860 domain-containing protein n=1 Tax=Flavonifractor sp. An92 TaxID=1965666 RepID=UPI000B3AF892|nr:MULTISPECIES: DUF4860 domain-containing protein [unclassified Flavonifractor]OUN05300.1 hypothetical protein B5G43_13505 [Flavonifractor sp. An92]OUQ22421.1 hypothetical protein B5E80_13655 [Flavonifractor sp. An135]